MQKTTKYLLYSAGGIATLVLGFALYQYAQIMRYTIKVKNIIPKKIDGTQLDFDVIANFQNNSNLQIDIEQQNHKIYLNGNYVTSVRNDMTNIIMPDSTSPIGFNVHIKFKDFIAVLGKEYLNILTNPEKFSIRIDMNFKIKFYGFKIGLPFTYNITMKDLTGAIKRKEPEQ